MSYERSAESVAFTTNTTHRRHRPAGVWRAHVRSLWRVSFRLSLGLAASRRDCSPRRQCERRSFSVSLRSRRCGLVCCATRLAVPTPRPRARSRTRTHRRRPDPLKGSPSCVCTPALDVATAASSNGGCACASRFRFRASPAGNVPARPNGRYDATLSLPAVLPAVSGSASRFVTLWDLFGPSTSSITTGFSGVSALAGSAPEADALSSRVADARRRGS